MEINTPLKQWRTDRKLTPKEAADFIGVSLPTWSRWENDKRQIPAERVPVISDKTGLAWNVLRPDVFPASGAAA